MDEAGHPLWASLFAVGLATLFHPMLGAAQDGGTTPVLEVMKEEETVSIASRYEQSISEAPSNVYVITDEDIRHSGATDLPTVLRRIPGMEIMQMSGADFNVGVRGDNQPFANKLLVMVDGRSIYLDVQGPVFWKALPVTLPEIKRIEVLKGPAAAVYGFNAFDGVINIITKSPDEMKGTTLQVGGGEVGTITSAAIHAGSTGNFGYRLSVGHDQQAQWRNRDALAFRSHKFNVDTVYALPQDSKLRFSGGFTDVNRFDGHIGEVVSQSVRPSFGYANMVYERNRFFIRAWWSGVGDDPSTFPSPQLRSLLRITDRDGAVTNPFRSNTYNVDLQHSLNLGSSHLLLYGLNYRHNTLSSSAIDMFSREDRLGVFVQDDWHLTSSLSLVAGLRYDLHSEINGTFSPRIALVYRPYEDHTFRAAFSVAYRPPTLFETHADQRVTTTVPTGLPLPFPPSFSAIIPLQGSARLDPEQILSYEIGYQGWFWNHRLRARTDLFFNHLANLIGNRESSSGPATFVNDSGRADIYGGEVGAEVLATKSITGFVNVSYQEINQSFQGTVRREGPRFKASAGLRGEWDSGMSAEATVFHVGSTSYPIAQTFRTLAAIPTTGVVSPSEPLTSYTLVNLRAGYRFWQEKAAAGYLHEAEAALSIFNALNDTHKEHPLGDTIGSRVMGWLTVKH